MDNQEQTGLEFHQLGSLVTELREVDQNYQNLERSIEAEQRKHEEMVGLLREQIKSREKGQEGRSL